MILMYHKISPEIGSMWWVSPETFYEQMERLNKKRVVYLDDYNVLRPNQCVITFDDGYKNVLQYAAPVLKHFGYPFEVFVIGKCVNDECKFQSDDDYYEFMDESELWQVIEAGGRLQWHSWSHPHYDQLKKNNYYKKELLVPKEMKDICPEGFKWFSYPYGERDREYINHVRKYFSGAVAISDGSLTNRYELKRIPVLNI
jgi:peptidoglycan/xylan/chitin deacetylase (PgdA/CDA1 family)